MPLLTAPYRIPDLECVMVECLKCGYVFLAYLKDFVRLVDLPHHPHPKTDRPCPCTKYRRIVKPQSHQVEYYFPSSSHIM